jgi:hypothetical protein
MCFGTDRSEDVQVASQRAGAVRIARRRAFEGGLAPRKLDEMARDLRRFRAEMEAERATRIDQLVAEAKRSGEDADRHHWTMVYDTEFAPSTTGRAMLLEHRIVPFPPQDLPTEAELHDELWTVVEGLAVSGVFLINTDHLGDRDLYCRLYYRILDEPTRLLPPTSEAAEFIDCLHPMDLEPGKVGHRLVARIERGEPEEPARGEGVRGPAFGSPLADRDRWMPRPNW